MIFALSFRNFSRDSFASLKHKLAPLASSCAAAVYFFFHTLAKFLVGNLKGVLWNFQNRSHLEKIPAFFWKSPPYFSNNENFSNSFLELVEAYSVLEGLEKSSLESEINHKLRKGYCHAECLMLVKNVQKNHSSLKEEISKLTSFGKEILILQMIEIFRECFQKKGRADLLKKNEDFLPSGFIKEICYRSDAEDLKSSLEKDLNGCVLCVVRMCQKEFSHTLLIEMDSKRSHYSFYNNASGYYSYTHLSEFADALIGHIKSASSFIESDLSFSYYNLDGTNLRVY